MWPLPLLILTGGLLLTTADDADNQLMKWASQNPQPQAATDQRGTPLPSLTATQTVGRQGPVVLKDHVYLDHLAHFNRERIPERVVHAKGGGAFGFFEVTHNITHLTRARLFSRIGKRTPILVRFSSTIPQSGGSDTVRDGRGFAVKFYTEDGNWDLVGNNLPVFPIRDPMLFPSLIHSRKRNPVTHLHDQNSFWDFNSLRPESTHHTFHLFSDAGIPDGFRFQHGFGVHTFKLVDAQGAAVYVKFHYRSNQGVRTLPPDMANNIGGLDPDYSLRDLYNAIEAKQYPSWTFGIQVMTFEQAEKYRWNPFDITKQWLFTDFPLIPVGRFVLNRNPTDYFTQIEQATFAPSSLVPGIEASPDRMLQGRLFAYADSQRYRVGPNFLQLPVNRPLPGVTVASYQKDGFMCSDDNGAGVPNYFPNSFGGPFMDRTRVNESVIRAAGDIGRTDVGEDDNYSQADLFWRMELDAAGRERLVNNVAAAIVGTSEVVQNRVITRMFDPVNAEAGAMLRTALIAQKKIARTSKRL